MGAVCAIDDCEKKARTRGWCNLHYLRWKRHGDPNRIAPLRLCAVADCDNKARSRGWCQMHYQRWWTNGDPNRIAPLRPPRMRGVDNPRWKGDDIKYESVHTRVRRYRGPAVNHSCQHCGSTAKDWAYDRTDVNERIDPETGFPYSTNLARYIPLCKPCHWRFDRTGVAR